MSSEKVDLHKLGYSVPHLGYYVNALHNSEAVAIDGGGYPTSVVATRTISATGTIRTPHVKNDTRYNRQMHSSDEQPNCASGRSPAATLTDCVIATTTSAANLPQQEVRARHFPHAGELTVMVRH